MCFETLILPIYHLKRVYPIIQLVSRNYVTRSYPFFKEVYETHYTQFSMLMERKQYSFNNDVQFIVLDVSIFSNLNNKEPHYTPI